MNGTNDGTNDGTSVVVAKSLGVSSEAINSSSNLNGLVISTDQVMNLPEQTKSFWKSSRVSANDLKLALRRPNLHANDLIDFLNENLEKAEPEKAIKFYNQCDRALQVLLLIPDSEVNIDLFHKLELEYSEIALAFLHKKKLKKPQESSVITHFTEFFSEDVHKELVYLLNGFKKKEARKILEAMGPKVLYLIAVSEIDIAFQRDPFIAGELFCALEIGDIIPLDFVFLNFVQEKAPLAYASLISELNSQNLGEFREMFYELQNRNKSLLSHFLEREAGEGGLGYLDSILGEE